MLPGGVRPASVRVRDGVIQSIEPLDAPAGLATEIDVGDAMLLPGLVDTHVHVNEPGRTEWEGFRSATRAAAAGGVTTLLDMPLNSIPATTSAAALSEKRAAAKGQCWVDVGFIGGVVPGNASDLPALHDAGVLAWKCFLVDSGVPEFAAVDEAALRRALPAIADHDLPLMVHAELPEPIAAARRSGVMRVHADYEATRPEAAEAGAVSLMLRLAEEFNVRVHIVHLSSRASLPILDEARARGIRVTVETCPHYLTFASEEIPDGATEFKCAPPIRSAADRDALWDALARGSIDGIVSDHSPSPPVLKHRDRGDFLAAWGGIASLQLGWSAVWHGAKARGIPAEQAVRWMTAGPAGIVRLGAKGRLAVGCDADLVVWDPDALWTVDGPRLMHRHALTPYQGRQLPGVVRATYLRGELVYRDGAFVGAPAGRLLRG